MARGLRRQLPIPADGVYLPVPMAGVPTSFETGEIGAQTIYFAEPVRIERVRGSVLKALAATDNGTITIRKSDSTVLATLTFLASAAINNNQDSGLLAPTPALQIAAGDYITITTAKTTAGGKVNLQLDLSAQR